MASIKLTGDTSGEITISAPAVAGTNTLTLPAETGSLLTDNISGDFTVDTSTFHVDSTNNRVGIGTTSPSSKLTVQDFGNDAALYVGGGLKMDDGPGNPWYLGKGILGSTGSEFLIGNGSNEILRIEQSGRVGIGTSSPDQNLHVSDTSTNAYIKIISNDSNTAGILFGDQNSGLQGKLYYLNGSDAMRFDTNSSERMRIDSSGNLLCNSTSLGFANQRAVQIQTVSTGLISIQHLNTEASGSAYMWFTHNGGAIGSITQNGTTGISYNVNSDYRLKENVDYTFDATSRLKQLKPCRFNFKADTDRTVDGFIAHEVSDIVPEAVTGEKDAMMTEEYEATPAVLDDDGNTVEEAVMGTREVPDYQGIDQSKLVPLLVKTCQEQQTIIEDLQTRITALENN